MDKNRWAENFPVGSWMRGVCHRIQLPNGKNGNFVIAYFWIKAMSARKMKLAELRALYPSEKVPLQHCQQFMRLVEAVGFNYETDAFGLPKKAMVKIGRNKKGIPSVVDVMPMTKGQP